ncbi:MAG TPA: ATP-binding protein [Xanthobacteraceae bacterium]|nr:ATP-binding protein [Xanthobacteraceae bacterium]
MSRLLPKSLFGQTLLVLLAGLVLSHAVGSWIYTADREQAVRAVGGFAAAQRIANLTRLVQEAPREWRERIVAAMSDQTLQAALTAQPPALQGADDDNPVAQAIKDFLAEQVQAGSTRQPRVAVSAAAGPQFADWHPMGHGPMAGRGPMMHGLGAFRDLRVAMPLRDGQWLSFETALADSGPAFSRQFLTSMAVMAVIIVGVSIWAVRRVTTPLTSLAAAAERLGRDVTAPPLPETGTAETRRASRAFNEMQGRLRSLIESRTRLLAAISHDLRTPLTLLRLRAENIEDADERGKMLATIAEMDAMIGAALQFARDETIAERHRPADVSALLQSVVDDMRDAGLPVTMAAAEPLIHDCQPVALKRAVTNLIDNAVKYGKTAHVAITAKPHAIEITIDDEGPGIPEADLPRVFEPFYRVEQSRSRETGGVGLGLAIAKSIVEEQDGKLTLVNRAGGGLRAVIALRS